VRFHQLYDVVVGISPLHKSIDYADSLYTLAEMDNNTRTKASPLRIAIASFAQCAPHSSSSHYNVHKVASWVALRDLRSDDSSFCIAMNELLTHIAT
jgi:hypothetical protein